jgi:hypothetical protein
MFALPVVNWIKFNMTIQNRTKNNQTILPKSILKEL